VIHEPYAALARFPAWVPAEVRNYLIHTETGLPLRSLARTQGVHASTVLRQVRRIEGRRDDPLFDAGLKLLSEALAKAPDAPLDLPRPETEDILRVLRRLGEPGAILAFARDMDQAVVVRDSPEGSAARTATLERGLAVTLAMQDWIASDDPLARVVRYRISQAGRMALRDMTARSENRARAMAEAPTPFRHRDLSDDPTWQGATQQRGRGAPMESPLIGLARRRDKDGRPFLSRDMVRAGERLREDFELAHVGQGAAGFDWTRALTGVIDGSRASQEPGSAKARVLDALDFLGPGLADVALRTCCFLEGMEMLEKRMGWSARSGKVVLRIALQRLLLHYATQSAESRKIG